MSILGRRGVRWFICANAFVGMVVPGAVVMLIIMRYWEWLHDRWWDGVKALHARGMPEMFHGECCDDNLIETMLCFSMLLSACYAWWLNRRLKRSVHLSIQE